jgi:hypothetical protein
MEVQEFADRMSECTVPGPSGRIGYDIAQLAA